MIAIANLGNKWIKAEYKWALLVEMTCRCI